MTGSTKSSFWLVMGMVGALVGGLLVGCSSSPQERYRVLSYFFDGVPDPNAPKQKVMTEEEEQAASGGTVVTASVITVHKPYKDKQCDACHRGANGDLLEEFDKAYDACLKCHKKVPSDRKLMHGPVAREACRFCHAPHESNQPALLKDAPIKVCTQCHDKALLGNYPVQHMDGVTSCLDCHFGHGGDARYFMKPEHVNEVAAESETQPATWPSLTPGTHPATQSATQPASQPATQPSAPRMEAGAAAGAGKCPGPVLVLSARPAGELAMGYGWRPDPGAPVAQERGP